MKNAGKKKHTSIVTFGVCNAVDQNSLNLVLNNFKHEKGEAKERLRTGKRAAKVDPSTEPYLSNGHQLR